MNASIIVPIRVDHRVFEFYLDMLPLCLESLQSQTSPAEVVVADYGSPDPWATQIRGLASRVRLVREDTHLPWSRSRAMNLGAGAAAGDLLIFVDCDVLCPQSYVAQHLAHHAAHPQSVASSRVYHLDQGCPRPQTWCDPATLPGKICSGGWSHFSVCRKDFEMVGGFDPLYEGWGGEDDDLLLRLKQHGISWRVLNCPMPLHIWHDGFVSLSLKAGRPDAAASPKKNHDRYYARKDGKL